MFGRDPKALTATLGEMAHRAHWQSNANQIEAAEKMRQWVAEDRRFDSFDHDRLVRRVQECRSCGAQLDLTDPQLQRGGQPRPLDRWR
jgi:hypothetical protein